MATRFASLGRRGVAVGILLAVVVATGAAAATLSVQSHASEPKTAGLHGESALTAGRHSTVPRSKVTPRTVQNTLRPGEVSYPSEGVDMLPAPSGYSPPVSSATALTSFKLQDVPKGALGTAAMTSLTPTVTLEAVTESAPVYAGLALGASYPAWVVTYAGTPPVSYGPTPISSANSNAMSCDFVGIFDLNNQAWTEFFQSCH